ncbi:MAG: asparaginase [Bdellovibrionaceae bacterium]|nr:asparaginase [Pseudobdellovibrionaceae bacterium]
MIVEILRGGSVESSHHIEACVQTPDGKAIFKSGDDFQFYPRSAVKPFQSQVLLETGTYKNSDLDLKHLALAAASHTGETIHTQLVETWLHKLNLSAKDLECGSHKPFDLDTYVDCKSKGLAPTALHNNCSGKHTGFLNVCCHMKYPTADYHLAQHPLQQHVKEILQNRLNQELSEFGIDGCSIPAYRMSFHSMAQAYAKMAQEIAENTLDSSVMVYDAFTQHPYLTSGKNEYCYNVMEKNKGRVLVKEGAEGVLIAVIPAKKMSIAIKAVDGAERGAQHASDFLLEKFAGLSPTLSKEMFNWAGRKVGQVQVRM